MSLAARLTLDRVPRSRLSASWIFFANGAALGSWIPHIPDAKHALSLNESVLGFALLGMAAGSLLGLPLSGALTARFGSRATTTAAILAVLLAMPLPILAPSLTIFTLALALLGLGVLALCALLAEGAIGDWAAVYLRDYAGTSAELAALGFAAFSLAMTAGRLLGDRFVRRYGGPR